LCSFWSELDENGEAKRTFLSYFVLTPAKNKT